MRNLLCCAALAALSWAGLSAETMDLDAARAAALAENRSILRAEASVRQAVLAEKSAKAELLPKLSANASWGATLVDGTLEQGDPSLGLSASQNLFSGGAKAYALESARLGTAEAREALRAARLAVLAELDTRFLSALENEEAYSAAIAAREAAERQLELAAAGKDAGRLSQAEYLQARSSWASKKTAETQAKWAAETGRRALSSYLGRQAEPRDLAAGEYEGIAASIAALAASDLEGLVQKLYDRGRSADPDLAMQRAAAQEAGLTAASKRASLLPSLSLSASVSAAVADGALDLDAAYPTVKLSASIPLFPIGTASIESARIEKESLLSRLLDAEEELRLSIYSSVFAVLSASGRIESASAALSYAQENYDLVLEKFGLGIGTAAALADAEAALASARSEGIGARFDLYGAVATLSRTIGAENESGLADALK